MDERMQRTDLALATVVVADDATVLQITDEQDLPKQNLCGAVRHAELTEPLHRLGQVIQELAIDAAARIEPPRQTLRERRGPDIARRELPVVRGLAQREDRLRPQASHRQCP